MINVLQIVSKYSGNYPLLNEQTSLDSSKFRTIVCYLSGANDGNNRLEKRGCKTIYLNIDKKKALWYRYFVTAKIKQIIEKENIHIINCHRHRATAIGVLASLLSNADPAIFSTIHGLRKAETYRRKLFNFFLYKKLAGIICISYAVGEYVLKVNWSLPASKVTVIQNGIPLDDFLNPRSKSECREALLPGVVANYWFGTVGRLTAVKNQKTLIISYAKLVEKVPDSILLIVGKGPLESELKNIVSRCGISDKVFFLGFRIDIPEVLNALDVFIIPSLREGLCLSLLEAMASGLPVIASRVGGVPEVFGTVKLGHLIEPLDIDGLAQAMNELASLPKKRLAELGANARQRVVTDFSATRMTKGYEKLFEETHLFSFTCKDNI
jgi:glycosyltransferase involved in cell wall biosynthesis